MPGSGTLSGGSRDSHNGLFGFGRRPHPEKKVGKLIEASFELLTERRRNLVHVIFLPNLFIFAFHIECTGASVCLCIAVGGRPVEHISEGQTHAHRHVRARTQQHATRKQLPNTYICIHIYIYIYTQRDTDKHTDTHGLTHEQTHGQTGRDRQRETDRHTHTDRHTNRPSQRRSSVSFSLRTRVNSFDIHRASSPWLVCERCAPAQRHRIRSKNMTRNQKTNSNRSWTKCSTKFCCGWAFDWRLMKGDTNCAECGSKYPSCDKNAKKQ